MTVLVLRVVLIALALFSMHLEGAIAQLVSSPEPTGPLRAGGDATYADLVRLVVPGIVVRDGRYSGGQTIEVRDISGADFGDLKPASTEMLRVESIAVRSGGLDRMALLLDFGSGLYDVGFAVLALFDVAHEPRLLDAANVAVGDHTDFSDPVRLSVGAGDDLLMTRSSHFNSSQHYVTTALILMRNDRLELVDTVSTFSERTCAFERTQQLDVQQKSPGVPFADIAAIVTEQTTASTEQCGDAAVPESGTRTISVTYRWDDAAQRYMPDSDAFAVLARENEKRF